MGIFRYHNQKSVSAPIRPKIMKNSFCSNKNFIRRGKNSIIQINKAIKAIIQIVSPK